MEIKDMVCDLEYAKKLRDLNIKKTGLFYFWEIPNKHTELISDNELRRNLLVYANNYCLTFTTDELFEILPIYIDHPYKGKMFINIRKYRSGYCAFYSWSSENLKVFENNKLSNVLAGLLIWCFEEKYITLNSETGMSIK